MEQYGIEHRVLDCDPDHADTAVFCAHYGYAVGLAANAIIVATKGEPVQYACCVLLATTRLDVNKKVRQLLGGCRASFASAQQTLELTGMQIGGVTPFGLPAIPLYVDSAVFDCDEVIAGGGNRTSKVMLNPHEFVKLPNMQTVEGLAVPKNA